MKNTLKELKRKEKFYFDTYKQISIFVKIF